MKNPGMPRPIHRSEEVTEFQFGPRSSICQTCCSVSHPGRWKRKLSGKIHPNRWLAERLLLNRPVDVQEV